MSEYVQAIVLFRSIFSQLFNYFWIKLTLSFFFLLNLFYLLFLHHVLSVYLCSNWIMFILLKSFFTRFTGRLVICIILTFFFLEFLILTLLRYHFWPCASVDESAEVTFFEKKLIFFIDLFTERSIGIL